MFDLISSLNEKDIKKIEFEDICGEYTDVDIKCYVEYWNGKKEEYYHRLGECWFEQ